MEDVFTIALDVLGEFVLETICDLPWPIRCDTHQTLEDALATHAETRSCDKRLCIK
jgi:hypothetical protein